MELIDRYIYTVIKQLPENIRNKTEKELKALIQNKLNKRCTGSDPTSSDVKAVLEELGNPSELANKYKKTKHYFIGPENYKLYIKVLKIAISVAVIATTIGEIISLSIHPKDTTVKALLELLLSIIPAALGVYAWVTIIFAITTKLGIIEKFKSNNRNSLKRPEKSAIKPSEPIIGIVFSVLLIIFFHFANQIVGIYQFENGKLSAIIPLFSNKGLNDALPLITILFALSILKECVKLIIRNRNIPLAIITIVLNAVSLVISVTVFTNPELWNENFIREIINTNIIEGDLINVSSIRHIATTGFAYILLIFFILDSVVCLYKGVKYS